MGTAKASLCPADFVLFQDVTAVPGVTKTQTWLSNWTTKGGPLHVLSPVPTTTAITHQSLNTILVSLSFLFGKWSWVGRQGKGRMIHLLRLWKRDKVIIIFVFYRWGNWCSESCCEDLSVPWSSSAEQVLEPKTLALKPPCLSCIFSLLTSRRKFKRSFWCWYVSPRTVRNEELWSQECWLDDQLQEMKAYLCFTHRLDFLNHTWQILSWSWTLI